MLKDSKTVTEKDLHTPVQAFRNQQNNVQDNVISQKTTDERRQFRQGDTLLLTRHDDITNSAKNFRDYTAKPIADAPKKHLKTLSQSEQVKQNEDSAKEGAKLVKPITANDKRSFNKPANCKDEYNRKIRQTG